MAILDGGNQLVQTFVWGSDLSGSTQGAGGVGGLTSMTIWTGANAGTYFPAFDGNGNLMALVNTANGVVAASYEYDAYGRLLKATGPMAYANNILYSTKWLDWETGFYYYGYRYYNPDTGRWLNRDLIEENGGLSLYGFAGNSPVNAVDSQGLFNWFFSVSGDANWAFPSGPFPYMNATSLPGELGAGVYNLLPDAGNLIHELFLKPAATANNIAEDSLEWTASKVFDDPQIGQNARNLTWLIPLTDVGKLGEIEKTVVECDKTAEIASSKVLGRNLENKGVVRPADSAAHHIVAGTDARALEARAILRATGISINDAKNGVFLPTIFHQGLHTNLYYETVNAILANAQPGSIGEILQDIANQLQDGTFPY